MAKIEILMKRRKDENGGSVFNFTWTPVSQHPSAWDGSMPIRLCAVALHETRSEMQLCFEPTQQLYKTREHSAFPICIACAAKIMGAKKSALKRELDHEMQIALLRAE